jgi:hypothetical protein
MIARRRHLPRPRRCLAPPWLLAAGCWLQLLLLLVRLLGCHLPVTAPATSPRQPRSCVFENAAFGHIIAWLARAAVAGAVTGDSQATVHCSQSVRMTQLLY